MFYNKSQKQMYFLLNDFNKTNNFKKSLENTKSKFNLSDDELSFRINECVSNNYINGVISRGSASNVYHNDLKEHIYITYLGYDFIKNYYSFIKKVLWNLFLIVATAVITAIVTVKINNWLSSASNTYQPICDFDTKSNANK